MIPDELLCYDGHGVAWFSFFAEQAFTAAIALQARLARMSLKEVRIKGYRVPYYQGGTGTPLVLLHGFADEKRAFLQAARWLTARHTVYLPDLPGHGDTEHDPERGYGIRSHVQILRDFTESLGLRELSLGGNSMGGHVAAAFALAHPGAVQRLLLMDPAGLREDPIPYQDEASPMDTMAKYEAFMHRAFVRPLWLPDPIKQLFIERSIANFTWLNRMLRDLRADPDYLLSDRINQITAPTLILWGAGDAILPVRHAEIWHAGIARSTVAVLKECGHAPQYEKPEETARLMLDFLAGRFAAPEPSTK